ncbi:hypothetical protein GCM10010452_68250 [Crossiella cryophila]
MAVAVGAGEPGAVGGLYNAPSGVAADDSRTEVVAVAFWLVGLGMDGIGSPDRVGEWNMKATKTRVFAFR